MRSSGPRRSPLLTRLGLRLVIAIGVGAGSGIVLSGLFDLPGWVGAAAGSVVFAAIYGTALLRLRRALVDLDAAASDWLAGKPPDAFRPAGIGEVDSLAVALDRAGRHFHRAQTDLRQEQDLLEVILEALPGGVLLVEGDNRVGYSNSECRQMLGELADPSGRLALRPIQALVRKVRQGETQFEETLALGYPERILGVRAISVDDTQDQEGRVLVVVLDLTETRRLETVRRDFVADASHELKTPVTSILASAEALAIALDGDPESARRFARRIEASAERLSQLIADLLDLSRLETGDQVAEPIDLESLVVGELEPFAKAASQKGIELKVHTEPVEVCGSAAELGLAVRNLFDNALRYSEEGGKIAVSLRAGNGKGIVTVSDTGIGIAGRDLGRIFERFYRVDVARSRQTGGTGLGLAIVKHVAERHGGRVTVNSLLGEGSTFQLSLPSGNEATLSD